MPPKNRDIRCKICTRTIQAGRLCEACTPVQDAIDALLQHLKAVAINAESKIETEAAKTKARILEELEKPVVVTEPVEHQAPSNPKSVRVLRPGGTDLLRPIEVSQLFGVSQMTLYRWEKAGSFPKRRALGASSVGWLEGELFDWIQHRPQGIAKGVLA